MQWHLSIGYTLGNPINSVLLQIPVRIKIYVTEFTIWNQPQASRWIVLTTHRWIIDPYLSSNSQREYVILAGLELEQQTHNGPLFSWYTYHNFFLSAMQSGQQLHLLITWIFAQSTKRICFFHLTPTEQFLFYIMKFVLTQEVVGSVFFVPCPPDHNFTK